MQDYGLRIYRSDLGKFFSVDPLIKKCSELISYQFASNTPLQTIDLDGEEALFVRRTWSDKATWGKGFAGNMLKETRWNKVQKQAYFGNWSWANSVKASHEFADGFYKWLTSDNSPPKELKHTTLFGHNHGGNINKTLKNQLENDGWKVVIVSIETPQGKIFSQIAMVPEST